ncbi:MAG: Crp/Fnr family transcriptional regulator [Bacteroidales bacterium]|jgi:CRP/FNR family transcriptional regulator|nr:Crp/Fnr family transcriptional regulator [Bacteroidales bacterium]
MYEKLGECFDKLSVDEKDFLASQKKQLVYARGENICKQGAFAPYVLYILDGMVRIFVESGHDKHLNIAIENVGSYIGFNTVFGDSVYHYSAVALTDSTICMIDKQALNKLFHKNKDFALSIISRNCRTEKLLLSHLRTQTHKQMPGKLAVALLYLNKPDLQSKNVYNFLTRKDIADFAGITPESTIKLLKEFEKDGLIKLDGKSVVIIDNNKLKELSIRG